MRKTRDLFKKIRDIKGTFHVKDRNSKDLAEAKEIKKRRIHRRTIEKSSK